MTDAFANASHLRNKNILLDPGGTGAPYSFTLFPRTSAETVPRENARLTFVARSNAIDPVVFTADAGDTILDPDTKASVSSLTVVLNGENIEFVYWLSRNQWVVLDNPIVPIVEFWTGTTIVDINAKSIQWTHVGPFASPIIFSHLSGVLTYDLAKSKLVRTQLNVEVDAIIAANNSDVDWEIDTFYTGAGLDLMPRIVNAFAHARQATFAISQQVSGGILMANADTVEFKCLSSGTSGSTTDLTSAILTASVEL